MHGELIEFNERLHRALVAKETLVSQMRQELIDLRGPVSAQEHLSLSVVPSLCLSTQPFCPQPHCLVCLLLAMSRVWKRPESKRVSIHVHTIQILCALTLMTLALFLGRRNRINKINAINSVEGASATFHTPALSINILYQ